MTTLARNEEQQIRDLVADWLKAVHARDVDAVMKDYAPDFTGYDLFAPTKVTGADDYRKNYEMWFDQCSGPPTYEIRELDVTAGEEVAFCRSLNRMMTPQEDGGTGECWLRVTVCFKKIAGSWKVVHEHVSVPLDMETQKGVFDFRP